MSRRRVRILMVSDRADAVESVRRALADATLTLSFHVTTVSTMAEFWTRIADEPTDIAMLDARLAADRGASVLQALSVQGIAVPAILLCERDADVPREGSPAPGAMEYLALDTLSSRTLVTAIRYAIELNRSRSTQKSVEDALQRAQNQLRDVVGHAGIFLCTHDLAGKILSIDEQSSRALGYGPRDLVGASLPDLLAPRHRSEFSDYLRKIVRDRTATGFMAVLTKNGETRYWNYQNRLSDDAAPIVHGTAVDVTERIRAEAASARAAELQAATLDALPAHIALLDHDGTILAVNAAWKRFATENGVDPSSVSEGINYLAACQRGGDPGGVEIAAAIREVLSGNRDHYETEYPCDAPGKARWFRVVVSPVRSHIRGAVVMHLDRTAERETEIERRRQAMIFENMHDSVVIADADGNIRDWNPSAARMLGLTPEQFLGRPVAILAPSAGGAGLMDEIRETAKGNGRWAGELEYRRPDGSSGLRELLVVPLRDPAGVLFGTAGISRDITQRRQAEEALRASEARYRNLFENNFAGIYRTSLGGRILDFNDAFARVFGYSHEELRTMNARELYFSEEDRQSVLDHLSRAGFLEGYECRLRRRDGSPVWVIENLSIVDHPEGRCLEGSLLDISDRRAVEEALRESEGRYRFLYEGNPIPMWIYEVETLRFLDVNAAAVEHYGYSREEFQAMTLLDIRPPEERDKLLREIADTARLPQPFSPWLHRRKDGTLMHVETSAVDLPGPGKRRMVIARDVTEKVTAERALQASEEKYRKIVDLSPVGIYQSTKEGKLLTCNDALARIFGFASADEMRAIEDLAALYDSPEERQASFVAEVEAGRGTNMELRLRRKDGSRVWIQLSGHAVTDDDGSNARFEGFVIDITERKRVEEQRVTLQATVLETAREWRDTFDAIETPVVVVDGRGFVRRLNRAAVRLSGRSFADLIGVPVASIGRSEPWRTAAELLRQSAARTSPSDVLCRDGASGLTWELSVTRFAGDSAESSLSIVIARDITMLVELQKSVMNSQSMAAMGALVAGVAHEVRNPLFAISATLDAFELRFQEHQEYKRYAGSLRVQVERMTTLMHDLLDFAKPAVFDTADVPVAEIMAEAARVCGAPAAARQVGLEIPPPDAPLLARVDRARTIQVFVNLIENAIQHSPPGSVVRLGSTRKNGAVICRVEDQGPGVDPNDLPRLFEPFFTRRPGGTGLGLAIVRRIVTEQGGSVTLENRPEGGARVEVALRASEQDSRTDQGTERKS